MHPILFEAIPPCLSWSQSQIDHWVLEVVRVLDETGMQNLLIPEIVSEVRRPFIEEKIEVLDFIALIKAKKSHFEPIATKVVTRLSPDALIAWIEKAERFGVKNLVLVGQESEPIGWTVEEAALNIKKLFPKINLGGVTIFSRPHEPERVAMKIRSGLQFFISQIIFETDNLKHFLSGLVQTPEWKDQPETPFYISFSPASSMDDLFFLKKLGVEFPTAVFADLTDPLYAHSMSEYENEIKRLIEDIEEVRRQKKVCLGYNIEHVMFHNLENAKSWLKHFKDKV